MSYKIFVLATMITAFSSGTYAASPNQDERDRVALEAIELMESNSASLYLECERTNIEGSGIAGILLRKNWSKVATLEVDSDDKTSSQTKIAAQILVTGEFISGTSIVLTYSNFNERGVPQERAMWALTDRVVSTDFKDGIKQPTVLYRSKGGIKDNNNMEITTVLHLKVFPPTENDSDQYFATILMVYIIDEGLVANFSHCKGEIIKIIN